MQTVAQKLSPSQREMLVLAQTPVTHTAVEIIKIHQSNSGVTHVARLAERESRVNRGVPRSIRLLSCRGWDVAMELVRMAGNGTYGLGHLDTLRRTLTKLTADDQRPLVLWLDRAGRMPVWEQEDLEARLETVSHSLGIPIRLVFLIQKTLVRDPETRQRRRQWVISEHLLRRAKVAWDFTNEGLEIADQNDINVSDPRRMSAAG